MEVPSAGPVGPLCEEAKVPSDKENRMMSACSQLVVKS